MALRKYLTGDQALALAPAVQQEVYSRHDDWGALGWDYVGKPDRLRIAIRVETTLVDPEEPVAPITLPGLGKIKPELCAAYGTGQGSMGFLGAGDVGGGGLLGPGSAVHVNGPEGLSRAGIAALLEVDGAPHLLSCGHVFGGSSDGNLVFRPGDLEPAAYLTANFLEDAPPLDAAICRVARPEALAPSTTWEVTQDLAYPEPAWHRHHAVFLRTHADGLGPVTAPIRSFMGCDYNLQNSIWQPLLCGLITMPGLSHPGDSGSLLAVDGAHFGICSGRVGSYSFFTPISAAMERISDHFGGCSFLSS